MLSALRARLREILLGKHQRILGDPMTLGPRLLRWTIILSGMTAGAAIWFLLIQGVEAQADSYSRMAPLVKVATSTWSYVALELLLLRGMLYVTNGRRARQAASYLGMEAETVHRFSAEAKSTDSTTRVICTSEDSEAEIHERLEDGLLGDDDDDVIRRNDPVEERSEERIREYTEQTRRELDNLQLELQETLAEVEERLGSDTPLTESERQGYLEQIEELEAAIDDAADAHYESREFQYAPERPVQDAAAAGHALADCLQAEGYSVDREPPESPLESVGGQEVAVEGESILRALRPSLLIASGFIALYVIMAHVPGWILGAWEYVPESVQTLVPAGARTGVGAWLTGAEAWEISIIFPLMASLLVILLGLAGYLWRRMSLEILPRDGSEEPEDTGESLPWDAKMKLWRMDTAAALQTGDLVWQFAVPASLTSGALVLIAGIWLQWWVYPLLFSGGIFIGAANYARISKSRKRELRALRRDDTQEAWDACSILVKHVEEGPATMAYAWFEGDGYANESAQELAAHLAPRVQQLLHGEEPDPSVCRKYYRNVRDMYPDLKGWRENVEEVQIQRRLKEAAEAAPDGIIPLDKLIEDVVLHDREPGILGLYQKGIGHDPELVRECYRGMYPWALVEEDMEIESSSGETHTVTAVRSRTDPLPAELSEVRANFASRFRAYAQWEPLYDPPEVEDSPEELMVQPGTRSGVTEAGD